MGDYKGEPFDEYLHEEEIPAGEKLQMPLSKPGTHIKFADNIELANILSSQLTTQLNMPREINTLYDDNVRYFLEVGPKWSLSKMIEATLKGKEFTAVPSLHPKIGDTETYRRAIAFLASINKINL